MRNVFKNGWFYIEYESTHRQRSIGMILCLTVLVILFSCGCDSRSNQYPFQKARKWFSSDPQISLCYTQNEDGTWTFLEELQWNDKTIKIDIAMQSDFYCVYPSDSTHHNDRLFSGSWKYRKGNLVFTVEEDFLLDGQYSEIIFVPMAD